MTPADRIEGGVDVLRVIDQTDAALTMSGLRPENILRRELYAARAAVAELVDADLEYDAAISGPPDAERFNAARRRRQAALSPFRSDEG